MAARPFLFLSVTRFRWQPTPVPCENCFVGGSFGTFRVRRPPVHDRSVFSPAATRSG